jgi:hypothetical protein
MKKSIGKKILCGIGIFVAILIILVVSAKFWLGATIKSAVNNLGPKVLGVPVEVESASVDIIGGKVRMGTLTIGNPEGFESTPYLFKLDGLSIDLAVGDILRGNTHIYDITVDGPHVWYHKKLTSSNVSALLDILEEKYPSDDKKKEDKKDDSDKEAKPVVIDHLLIKEGTVGIKMGIGGEVPLLEIELKDIGKDGAMMPVQIIKLLITSIVKGVLSAVANVGGAAIDAVGDVGGAAVDAVGDVGGAAIDAVGDVGKAAVGAVGSVAKGIGSLFGGSSDTNAPAEAPAPAAK